MEWLRTLAGTLIARIRASSRLSRVMLLAAIFLLLSILISWWLFISAPSAFPTDRLVIVEEGAVASALAKSLKDDGVIRSPLLFHAWMRVTGADRSVHAGTYYFSEPLNLFQVADRIARGDRGIESIRVTLTEGMTAREMGEALSAALPDFDAAVFTEVAKGSEGYLFPDTYFIDPGTGPEQVLARLTDTFNDRTEALRLEAQERGIPFSDVVIMASLLEKEADTAEGRRMVSGILQNRLKEDMPLQVDAVFGYILDRSGYAPTGDDLDMDSPYNTYLNRGLPPGPIANPGLDALAAALDPIESDYVYYLTGRDGNMYYARTFDEHKMNRELYLD